MFTCFEARTPPGEPANRSHLSLLRQHNAFFLDPGDLLGEVGFYATLDTLVLLLVELLNEGVRGVDGGQFHSRLEQVAALLADVLPVGFHDLGC